MYCCWNHSVQLFFSKPSHINTDLPLTLMWLDVALSGVDRFVQYKATSLEKQHKHELLTEPDLGVTIDLINPDTYRVDPSSTFLNNIHTVIPHSQYIFVVVTWSLCSTELESSHPYFSSSSWSSWWEVIGGRHHSSIQLKKVWIQTVYQSIQYLCDKIQLKC